jgi:hypothetical protein
VALARDRELTCPRSTAAAGPAGRACRELLRIHRMLVPGRVPPPHRQKGTPTSVEIESGPLTSFPAIAQL